MGVKSVLGKEPLDVARAAVRDRDDESRRAIFKRRVDLYTDCTETMLLEEASQLYARERVQRIRPFLRVAASLSLGKRVIDEIARPVYATAPVRRVFVGEGQPLSPAGSPVENPVQGTFNALARECRLNQKMSLSCRLAHAANTVFLHPRCSERLGLLLDVITPEMVTVIPDPDDPVRELAVIYDIVVKRDGKTTKDRVYWDDEIAFRFDEKGNPLPQRSPRGNSVKYLTAAEGHPGILPFVAVHRQERWGTYWDTTSGRDLEMATLAVQLLLAVTMRLHKTQGHTQLGITNSPNASGIKDLMFDEEAPLLATDGRFENIANPTPADHFHKTIDLLSTTVAANYGISRDRLNQQVVQLADAAGLLERRDEAVGVFWEAEQRLFEVVKAVSLAHPEHRLPAEARLEVSFAEITAKVDREKLLAIQKEERRQGRSSIVENVLEDKPELGGDRARAWELIEQNLEDEATYIEKRRALNIPEDASPEEPGQDPAANGANGPRVRDGQMTRDQAAEQARKGPPPPGAARFAAKE
jgi:hypothetical protein